jgi:response regulator RpfG family c-di-GMP phosphodiesterase
VIATILLVEADVTSRITLGRMLRRSGYHLLTAPDRTSGRQTAVDARPDLVVINLRNDDGPRLCAELGHDLRAQYTPVLIMSAVRPGDAAAPTPKVEHYLSTLPPFADLLRHIGTSLRGTAAAEGVSSGPTVRRTVLTRC